MQKNGFGDWLREQIDLYQISVVELSDYSGIHTRTLYRILSGSTKIDLVVWLWLIECISDMTDREMEDLLLSCLKDLIG